MVENAMRKQLHEVLCPRCLAAALRRWEELDRDGKTIFERLPAAASLSASDRKRARFCTRCLFVDRGERDTAA
jgi:hypothetical protein